VALSSTSHQLQTFTKGHILDPVVGMYQKWTHVVQTIPRQWWPESYALNNQTIHGVQPLTDEHLQELRPMSRMLLSETLRPQPLALPKLRHLALQTPRQINCACGASGDLAIQLIRVVVFQGCFMVQAGPCAYCSETHSLRDLTYVICAPQNADVTPTLREWPTKTRSTKKYLPFPIVSRV
jgi:hypothetical protein